MGKKYKINKKEYKVGYKYKEEYRGFEIDLFKYDGYYSGFMIRVSDGWKLSWWISMDIRDRKRALERCKTDIDEYYYDEDVKDYLKSLNVGDKVKFMEEKQRYTIKAKSDRFIICTKPFNLKKTCLYTIIDLNRMTRGTNDRVFNPYDYMLQEDIDKCLEGLDSCKVEVSYRNCIPLNIVK